MEGRQGRLESKEPSIAMMDNTKCHCTHPNDVPKGKNACKKDWQECLCSRQVSFDQKDTVPMLKTKAKEHISKHECMLVQVLVDEKGHKAPFTPPHHSNLQPVKLLWAKLKGSAGRKHNSNTTMTILKACLDAEFQAGMS